MVKYTGYIEGYYGRELSWEQRFAMINHLGTLGMNVFLYAPKEDPYHRVQWKKMYPAAWQRKLKKFTAAGKRSKVEVIPALAPGLSYEYRSVKDYALLLKKFRVYFGMGINTVALLMDDIPEELPASCRGAFSSLGEAHGLLLQRLFADLRKINPKIKLWFCPTIYTDQFVKGRAVDCMYIRDLARTIPSAVTLMWTGPQVVSEKINQRTCGGILKLFNGNVVIWDNLYANDYAPYRLFVGPYEGRAAGIIKISRGILINPTGLFHTDRFLLSLFADFLAAKKATVAGWEKIAEEYGVPRFFNRIRHFFWTPFRIPDKKEYSKKALDRIGDLWEGIIVPWQNPLKLEWYPYLYGLLQDINYLEVPKAKCVSWLGKRYFPISAQRMVRR
ncbi:MAG: hypothetical protein DRI61_12630 [Chloroflexi bacterium]|nr:MAG: hypothetical protein DRI61_12630 [Chloroflexota bacterium]